MLPNFLRQALTVSALQFLKDDCAVERLRVTIDDYGAQDRSVYEPVYAGKCRLIQPGEQYSSQLEPAAGQETLSEGYRLSVPNTITMQLDDRVEVSGEYYRVVRVEDRLTDDLFHHAILAKQ